MVTFGKLVSSVVGVMAMHGLSVLLQSPISGAFWGWKLSVPAGVQFTCAEGTLIGCPGYGEAGYSSSCDNFTCTVQANAGYSCDVSSIEVKCSDAGSNAKYNPLSGGSCLNNVAQLGANATSTLSWVPSPVCTTGGGSNGTTTKASTAVASGGNVIAPGAVLLGVLAVTTLA